MKFRKVSAITMLLSAIALIAACGADPTATPTRPAATPTPTVSAMDAAMADLVQAAAAEGELNFLGSGIETGTFDAIEEAINAKYGINIRLTYTSGPSMNAMASRLDTELDGGQAPSTDMYIGRSEHIGTMIQNGTLQSFDWGRYLPAEVAEHAIVQGDVALAMGGDATSFAYNTNLVAEADVPQTLEDLLDPKWAGEVITTPYAAYYYFAALHVGQAEFDEWVEKFLATQIGAVLRCGDADEAIATGEHLLYGLSCGSTSVRQLKEDGAPIENVFLEELGIIVPQYVGITKGSGAPNLAALFAIFLTTPEGQDLLWEQEREGGLWFVDGTYTNEIYKAMNDPLVADVDFVLANQETITELTGKYIGMITGG